MLRSLKDIIKFKIIATDGEIGHVDDFYFDDMTFNIRYLVVETGNWFNENKVLLSPNSLNKPDFEEKSLHVNITRELVQNSPSYDSAKPISRDHEENMANHYGWPLYWTTIDSAMIGAVPPEIDLAKEAASSNKETTENKNEYNLRSAKEVIGYSIQAKDGEIGEIDDFIIDDEIWSIRYAVVDTGNFLSGKKVLIAIPWIGRIDWQSSSVFVDLTKNSIEKSPKYDHSKSINNDYENELFDHYEKPRNK